MNWIAFILLSLHCVSAGGPNDKTTWGSYPVIDAASDGKLEMVAALVKAGAEVNAVDNQNRMALHWASDFGHFEVVQYLLQHGANLKKADTLYPLLVDLTEVPGRAPRDRLLVIAQYLIERGARVNPKPAPISTPLGGAVCLNHLALAKLFLEKGARVDFKDSTSRTPMARAVECRASSKIKKLLLAYGAESEKATPASPLPLESEGPNFIGE